MIISVLSLVIAVSSAPQSRPLGIIEAGRPNPARSAPAQPQRNANGEPAEVEQVCRNQEVTGSRFPIRVCRSVRQTDADRDESREMLRQIQGQRKQEPLI